MGAAVDALRDRIPDYARDIRVNLGNIITVDGAPELSPEQLSLIALSCARALKNPELLGALQSDLQPSEAILTASGTAAALMAMNNVYYRFMHLVHDEALNALPAKLRMTALANPGVPKTDFELASLAVSSIGGCGMCMESHTKILFEHGVSKIAVQSAVRIAAVLNAAVTAMS